MVTPNGDSFDAAVFDLEKQEQAWPPGSQTATYPTRAGATLAAWAALKRLGFTAKAAKPETETETERQPASIWTISAQETVARARRRPGFLRKRSNAAAVLKVANEPTPTPMDDYLAALNPNNGRRWADSGLREVHRRDGRNRRQSCHRPRCHCDRLSPPNFD